MDYTRLTQFGTWDGSVVVGGQTVPVAGALGTRDRSWGIRPVGEREVQPPGPIGGFFWLWAPINFDDVCTHADSQENEAGRPVHRAGTIVPVSAGGGAGVSDPLDVAYDIRWRPGTRRADHATIHLGSSAVVELEPILDFQMCGIGYFHPIWSHGVWHGEEAVGSSSWVLADLDPMALQNIHVQQLCRATMGDRVGTGVLELLVVGPHEPSGFKDLLDPAV
jgi:hypothetical protein